ncbi:MAG TPA: hypothetical protein V6C89_02780 [Drouetiella sp.]|jgi:hypothetical protein
MDKNLFLAGAAVLLFGSGAIASEPATPSVKPNQELNQRASEAVHDIGANMNKAGAAIKQTVDAAESKVSEAGKKLRGDSIKSGGSKSSSIGTPKSGRTTKPDNSVSKGGSDLEAGAKKALNTLEANADKAEHAVVNTVKGMSKQAATKGGANKTIKSGAEKHK